MENLLLQILSRSRSIEYLRLVLVILIYCSSADAKSIRIAVFDSGPAHSHQAKVIELINKNLRDCKSCVVKLFPIFNEKGELTTAQWKASFAKASQWKADVWHFSWNLPFNESFNEFIAGIKNRVEHGIFCVAAAGDNAFRRHRPLKLHQTVMGRVDKCYIIAEETKRGYLHPRSNYGKSLRVTIPQIEGFEGSSFSAARFTAWLATFLEKHGRTKVSKRLEGKQVHKWADLQKE
jgi:hypothetical protein